MKRLQYNYNLKGCSKISNIPYNLIFTTKFFEEGTINYGYLIDIYHLHNVTCQYQIVLENKNK
jgi:hypothetical protein